MIRFETGATLTHATARTVLDAGLARIAAGVSERRGEVDCAQLARFDSSALAVLLAWLRTARESGVALSILNLPAGLVSLARLYGIDSLLSCKESHDAAR